MDHWNEASWPQRAHPPALRAVSGRSVRVLHHHADPSSEAQDGIRVLVVSDDVLARRGVLDALDDQPGLIIVGDRRPGPGVAGAVLFTTQLSSAESRSAVSAPGPPAQWLTPGAM